MAVRAGNRFALWLFGSGFTLSTLPAVSLSRTFSVLCSFLELPAQGALAVRPFPMITHDSRYNMASADSCRLSPISQLELRATSAPLDSRSPQIRTLTFPAHLPDLLLCSLMTWTSCYWAHSSELTASYRVCVPQVADLPRASFRPHLTATPLPLANG